MWYEVKVKYFRINENDTVQRHTEVYLIDAISFAEAESRAIESIGEYISVELKIEAIKKANFAEVIPNDDFEKWFKCKLSCITIDEEKGIEKRASSYVLVQADSVNKANDLLSESLIDSITNFEIPSVAESPVLEVFPYEKAE